MADQDRPNQAANTSKAEGERWTSEPDTVENADRDEHPERLYDADDADDAGGITNRPLSDEIGRQESLPERGTYRDQTRNPDSTRPEGDYTEDER
jgi:hypothetical protein